MGNNMTYYLLPTTHYLLPTTYYLLPTTYYLLHFVVSTHVGFDHGSGSYHVDSGGLESPCHDWAVQCAETGNEIFARGEPWQGEDLALYWTAYSGRNGFAGCWCLVYISRGGRLSLGCSQARIHRETLETASIRAFCEGLGMIISVVQGIEIRF